MPLLKSWRLGRSSSNCSLGLDTCKVSPTDPSTVVVCSVGEKQSSMRERESGSKFKTDAQYILACLGSAVGLGNLLRFPNLCYKYNGFGFLLPYLFALVFIGVPMLGMEIMFGTISQRSAVKAFGRIRPFLWGLGAYVTWAAFMVVSYYNVIMAWSLQYLYYSFQTPLPWGSTTKTAEEFFFGTVLRMRGSDGELWTLKDGMGPLNWPLLLSLLGQWALIFICVFKLTKTVQWVVTVTVPLPFLLIAVMTIYGLTKEGASSGVMAYINPTNNPGALLSLDAWVDACGQIFFGLSLSTAVMIGYSSHQAKDSKMVRNTWIIAIGNSMTSIVAGFAVFALLGHFAFIQNESVDSVASSGYILSFQTFPATFSSFSGKGAPQAFSVLFFLTLLLLGIDSAMSLVEAVCEAFIDNNTFCRKHVPLVVFVFCSIGFLFSFIMATKSGYYVLDILDHFSSTYLMLMGGGLSAFVVGWLYPADKLVRQVRENSGEDAFWLPFLWAHMIKFFTPLVLALLFGYNFVRDCMRPYNGYQHWALVCFGWIPCLVIPTLAFGLPSLFIEKPSQIRSKLQLACTKRASHQRGTKTEEGGGDANPEDEVVDTVRSNTSVVTMDSLTHEV
ncbi:sodium/chloride symporter [Chloropicon primus]|uniref:Sodium/chloride symporter n=1 Tax=Chloropicon primus TaxID=1764295 RepID=A0A5B8MU55_9CHLO|nr:sodium/chloride symporter [Chloropicon primus]UPR02187.1 sodium/chloride symporter [Chloropicon primus]|mmetsp:Transcript_10346/g.29315  ORF Transcript_10346/g.29315 Transcript_10346/m.29315 type:complete len:615 (+) Transcript_10346:96-1940(+)|eukprot:QDZ22970.1 sodium/chloride symporter [Chloropicon primus]